jgi:hypothetical protein
MSEEITNNQPQTTEAVNPAENTETTQTNNTNQNSTVEQPTEVTDYSTVNTVEKASEVLESKGFDYDALTEEFQAHGDLLPETRAKLEKQGITGEILDGYIEGQKAIIQRHMEDISTVVGGMEQMATVIEWAKVNLTDEEKKSIDAVHDPAVIKIILKDLEQRMNDSEGYLPQQLQGGAGGTQGNYFESMLEVEEAINDPRYSKDPVYRAKIAKKITASREAGILEIK